MKYFRGSFLVTLLGLVGGAALGWEIHGTVAGTLGTTFIVAVLAVLEVSLSFDNAVVNATVLREMDPVWRRRFITWGIAIAVFGMRIVFPLAIVAIVARIDPWEALVLSATRPDEYSHIIESAHVSVAAFGGAFLLMVGFKHFLDEEKDVHWIPVVERPLVYVGRVEAFGLGVVLFALWAIAAWLPEHERYGFLVAGIFGLLTFIGVDGIAAILDPADVVAGAATRSGAAAFLYLEVLDASFSFDGVIGAFALSNNLFVIAIGLGIGAMFVRSLTIMLVDRETLTEYRYLEHGAFYAIIALGVIMFVEAVTPIPEVVTGLVGAAFIGLSFWHSLRDNRREGHA
ncbi:MAG: DUF475 domain-containing protein [Deltaproteobacteria bacterium]|nr:DUF475 domain-containing protein [Deltaproteobacteria bacterium]